MDVRIKIDPETGSFKAIMMWHPINGEWVHIAQEFDGENTKYYINGVVTNEIPSPTDEMVELIAKVNTKEIQTEEVLENEDES